MSSPVSPGVEGHSWGHSRRGSIIPLVASLAPLTPIRSLTSIDELPPVFFRDNEANVHKHDTPSGNSTVDITVDTSDISIIEDDVSPLSDTKTARKTRKTGDAFFPKRLVVTPQDAPAVCVHVPYALSVSPPPPKPTPLPPPAQVTLVPRNEYEAKVASHREEIRHDSKVQGAFLGNGILLLNAVIGLSRSTLPTRLAAECVIVVCMLLLSSIVCIFLKLLDRHIRWSHLDERLEVLREYSRQQPTAASQAQMEHIFDKEIEPLMSSHAKWLPLWRVLWVWALGAQPVALAFLFGGVICQLPTFSSVPHCAVKTVVPIVVFAVLVVLVFLSFLWLNWGWNNVKRSLHLKTPLAQSFPRRYVPLSVDDQA